MKVSKVRLLASAAAVAGSLGMGVVAMPGAATAAARDYGTPVADGLSSTTAAASCWAIKQTLPASPDGVYWLQTAQLVAPKQFYCDMTTDGGGWVLIGRGREGWTWSYNGQGSQATLRNTPSGPGAFAPAALPADLVQGLLGGGRVDALDDGIRVRRATTMDGSGAQELRLKTSNRAKWTWSIGGGVLVSDVVVDGVSRGGGNTQSWAYAGSQSLLRMTTNESSTHNYKMGFSYGNTVVGKNDPMSYLWQYTTEKSAIPFAQVFIRPKLMSSDYTAVPAEGLPATTLRPLMSSTTSDTTPWGVTGVEGGISGELKLEVETFAYIGRTMYVGGMFANVQKGANPGPDEKVHQPYLAAFDLDTGEWKRDFRPVLDGEVWDLQATPDGKLIVAGEFTNVGGAPHTSAVAAVDPLTGAPVTTWTADVTNVSSDGTTPQVRALDYQDGWIYIGGRFNRIAGGTPLSNLVTVGRTARVRASDGKPDGTWKPNFDGSIIEMDASDRGDRVYFSGYFKNVNGTPSSNIAVVSTAAGAPNVQGLGKWVPSIGSGTATYQQTIKEFGNDVWQGGSEHILGKYDRDTYTLQTSNITKSGGDFQALTEVDGVVYGSCHCGNYNYSNDLNYSNPIPYASDVNGIKYIGAWDEATGAYLPDFFPSALDTRSGMGPWELTADPNGCLWFGGDMKQGSWTGTAFQWLGGFGKFCPRDTTAPTTPAALSASNVTAGVKLSWAAATDNASGTLTYEVLRNDRVIGTTTGTSFTDPTPGLPATYFVRAVDDTGNRSATTTGLTVQPPPDTLVAYGSAWRWNYDGTDQGTAWSQPGFDDSTWSLGASELGFGDNDEATVVAPVASKHPITAYFRTTVDVANPASYSSLLLNLVRDDGAVVYVNGVEVARDNMPAGAPTATTPAVSAITLRADEKAAVSFTVPASVLVPGTNTIAVEVHQSDVWSPDLSFNLQVQAAH
ncbi:hypothetical protein CLV35_3128 [Motilibacter peucedani]|uniref:Fibrinogen beta/gamma subunit family protein n=1 Tax=Motilibacter peucedani TaxID=598650 RepID=A0A420XLG7_9ACTN|nr:fibrinogen-like YCDxxxxGGGW domain-containing protein [Motilibacter peucedani]RKS71332.1 hypothetical protein CLV35_3128 [Motilibacter peucedani]